MENVILTIIEPFKYLFIYKALIAGIFIALSCSFLGLFLVLKKLSLIGDGLAHVSFATIAIALFFSFSPIIISIPLVILSSFLIIKLNEKSNMYGDSAIGLVSSFAIALGVIISSQAKGFNIDLFSFLFGSILAITYLEVVVSIILSIIIIAIVILFYNDLFATTYDEDFASISGIKVNRINYLLITLTSITIVIGIRMVGTMLISSMIIFPTISALQLSTGFKKAIILSSIFSVYSVITGILFSYYMDIPTGATIVMMNTILFIFSFIWKKAR